jgi:hypothetical protein
MPPPEGMDGAIKITPPTALWFANGKFLLGVMPVFREAFSGSVSFESVAEKFFLSSRKEKKSWKLLEVKGFWRFLEFRKLFWIWKWQIGLGDLQEGPREFRHAVESTQRH